MLTLRRETWDVLLDKQGLIERMYSSGMWFLIASQMKRKIEMPTGVRFGKLSLTQAFISRLKQLKVIVFCGQKAQHGMRRGP
jgi:hypothetical protein